MKYNLNEIIYKNKKCRVNLKERKKEVKIVFWVF